MEEAGVRLFDRGTRKINIQTAVSGTNGSECAGVETNRLIMHKTLVNGIPDYTEEELHKVSVIHDLLEAGMGVDVLQKYPPLRKETAGKTEQIRILRKQRCELMVGEKCIIQCLEIDKTRIRG